MKTCFHSQKEKMNSNENPLIKVLLDTIARIEGENALLKKELTGALKCAEGMAREVKELNERIEVLERAIKTPSTTSEAPTSVDPSDVGSWDRETEVPEVPDTPEVPKKEENPWVTKVSKKVRTSDGASTTSEEAPSSVPTTKSAKVEEYYFWEGGIKYVISYKKIADSIVTKTDMLGNDGAIVVAGLVEYLCAMKPRKTGGFWTPDVNEFVPRFFGQGTDFWENREKEINTKNVRYFFIEVAKFAQKELRGEIKTSLVKYEKEGGIFNLKVPETFVSNVY